MPELPEVETIRKTLKTVLIGKEVKDITVYWPKIIQKPDDTNLFKETLQGQILEDIKRKGKFLIFEWTDIVMVSHLRMEGKYGIFDENEPIKKHTHVIFHFRDHTELRYNDVRKFGTMHLFKKGQEITEKPLSLLAPDPFEPNFSYTFFEKKIQSSARVIKNILLDQAVIAGIGNIYVDETLFLAGVHPLTLGNKLKKKQIRAIFDAAVITLEKAIAENNY